MFNRNQDSHKGDNGKVLIIGGSDHFHGAPILSALGAEYSGADFIFPIIPKCHVETAKNYSLNFIIQTFNGDILTSKDIKSILNFSSQVDAVVIGPGLGSSPKTKKAVKTLLSELKKPTIIDSSAILYTNLLPKKTIITPHHGEFKRLTGDDPTPENVQKWAESLDVTIVCKGPKDIIANKDEIAINDTGNALMTVGGSGDVLSGLIGGFVAQGMPLFEAGKQGVKLLGQAGDNLSHTYGSIRAIDLAESIPALLK